MHHFSETSGVEIILQEAENMLSPHLEAIGPKNARWIWAFISKFVMLDHFSRISGAVDLHPGLAVARKLCSPHYLGRKTRVRCSTWIICFFWSGMFRSWKSFTWPPNSLENFWKHGALANQQSPRTITYNQPPHPLMDRILPASHSVTTSNYYQITACTRVRYWASYQ